MCTIKNNTSTKHNGISRDSFLQAVAEGLEAKAKAKGLRMASLFAEDLSEPDYMRPIESVGSPWWKLVGSKELDLLLVAGSGNDTTRWDDGVMDMSTWRFVMLDETRLVSFAALHQLDGFTYSDPIITSADSEGRSLWLVICDGLEETAADVDFDTKYPLVAEMYSGKDMAAVCPELAREGSPDPQTAEGKKAVEFIVDLMWNQKSIDKISSRIDGTAFCLDKSPERYFMDLNVAALGSEAIERYGISDDEYRETNA